MSFLSGRESWLKTQRFTNYSWEKAALGTCFAIMLMALIVLVGWHAQVLATVQIFRGFILFSILGVARKETEAGTF
ncbi:MAG: hypothetical protein ACR2HX_23070 [Pyrinomonadaceae bacterium]